MTKIKFISHDGNEKTVEAVDGMSIMVAATNGGVTGIDADCGGACACATCHVYVDPEWLDKVSTPSTTEIEMLGFVQEPQPNSRLACQITITEALEGLVVRTPKNQS
jgi:2Fe-2S ferredoxin